MSYKENKQYQYWNKIRKQCNEFYYFDETLTYKEREYFYNLKLDAIKHINNIQDIYGE